MSKKPPPTGHDDNPEWTDDDFARAKPATEVMSADRAALLVRPRGRPAGASKVPITLRVDKDVAERWRSSGTGWQTRMNEALRAAAP